MPGEGPGDIIQDSGIEILMKLWESWLTVMRTPLELWGYQFTWLDVFWFSVAVAICAEIVAVTIKLDDD